MDCPECGFTVQFDRDQCIAAGGDRTLMAFRDTVREKKRCRGYRPAIDENLATCALRFTELVQLLKEQGKF